MTPDPGDTRLRVLHLEDDPFDAELAAATLAGDGLQCDIERVATREDFEKALFTTRFDVVLSDYNLPGFDGLTAQGIAQRLCPDVPFIFLSGALGEDLAADRLKDGATDFVLKQRMAKLPLAIRRACKEAELRDQARRAESSLRALNAELENRIKERTAELSATGAVLARREAELDESRKRLEAILDHSPLAITVSDLTGRYVLVNKVVERVLGRPADQIIGKTPHDVMPARLADRIQAHNEEVMKEKRGETFEEVVLQADGTHVFQSTRFPLYDGEGRITAVCNMAHDITAEKKAEEELKLARLEALRASHAKNEFLSHMSHELRTPLNAILGFAQLFDQEAMAPEQAENVSQILLAGRHLLDLINGVIDIARVESGKLSLSPEAVDAGEAVRTALDLVRPLASARGIALDVRPLPDRRVQVFVRADKQRLAQVLINLLSNAVKYNRPRGRITVDFSARPQGLRISVTDTGAGIPPAKLKLLFQPFERLGAESSDVEGTGLGLAFSRAACQAMDGHLGVESQVDVGSTFWVDLPLSDAADRHATAPEPVIVTDSSTDDVNRQATIVYIEDNSSNVRLMERMLARRPGITLVHIGLGRAGVERVVQDPPDLVLLDMHLPDISGEDVLRQLWEDTRSRDVPVVVLSADATPGLPGRLQSAGARGFLSKPLNVKQVLGVIDQLLREQGALREP